MRKTLSLIATFVVFWLSAAALSAAEPAPAGNGNVPPEMLAQFNLGQMEVLSDKQGEEIRGNGFFLIYNYRWYFFHGKHLPHQHLSRDFARYVLHHGSKLHDGGRHFYKHAAQFHQGMFSHYAYRFIFHRFAKLNGGHKR